MNTLKLLLIYQCYDLKQQIEELRKSIYKANNLKISPEK